ncbi:dexamethasone-induced Ras-related protein 1-like [Patiria miniata]|uniref:GTP-binding protein Rhes n=1 Tax=Patiria miniata TaxID=46514 RepID=A0A914AUP7_PATMI|nr:dexamethasone-induced Ras-related protein 1-like [Patiria miniata]
MKNQVKESVSYRLVVMGPSRVGKTALISMFLRGQVSPIYYPTVENCHTWQMSQGGRQCHLDIIDTSGSKDFPAMYKLYISTAQIFVLVHSLEDPQSFEEVLRILEEINRERPGEQIPIFVIGNKSDRPRPIGMCSAEAELLLIDYMDVVRYTECNSRNRYSVDSVFAQITDVVFGSFRCVNGQREDLMSTSSDKKCKGGLLKKWKSLRRR